MTVAILGGTGFIGSAAAQALVARGEAPLVVSRGVHPVQLPPAAIHERAGRDTAALVELFRRHGVDTVIDIFALGTRNTGPVLAAMRETGGRYVLLSSVDVYSNYAGLLKQATPPIQAAPAREDDPLRTVLYPYRGNDRRPRGVDDDMFEDYDKIPLEQAALGDPAFTTTVIRAPMVFGPGDKQHRFGWAIGAIRNGSRIGLDERAADWPNSYGYVEDIGAAIALAALSPAAAGRIYNVGQPFVRTPVEWLTTIAAVMGAEIAVDVVPPDARGLLADRADASDLRYPLTLDTTRIRTELGFSEPTPEREALERTIADEIARAR
jgi:nucleoside-diphosphate-sugar epimerase